GLGHAGRARSGGLGGLGWAGWVYFTNPRTLGWADGSRPAIPRAADSRRAGMLGRTTGPPFVVAGIWSRAGGFGG
ncbi:hypothetical protein ACWKSP_05160, partial [Micromonosporaceae bacterium Da 78-11]